MARFVVATLLVALGLLAAIPGAPPAPARAHDATPIAGGAFTHVAADGAVLRDGPGDDAPVIGLLAPGTPVRDLGEPSAGSPPWSHVAAPGNQTGWVRLADLTAVAGLDSSITIPLVPESVADPIVGTWVGRGDDARIVTFFADGAALLADDGQVFLGAWRRSGGAGVIGTFAFRATGPGATIGPSGSILMATEHEIVLDGTALDRLSAPELPASATTAHAEAEAPTSLATPVAVPPVAEDPFPGITIVSLAVGAAHFGAGPDASLSRVTIDPGYALDYPFPYPVIVAVEAGTLAVDAAAPGVTVTSPPRVDERGGEVTVVHDGEAVITRQIGDTVVRQRQSLLDPGESALLGPGGSASAGAGGLHGLRNAGSDPLVVLLVAVPPPGAYGDVERSSGRGRVEVAAVPVAAEGRRMRPLPCRVAPRTREEVERIVAQAGPPRESVSAGNERSLPSGEPADPETIAAVARLEREFAGCLNAADWPRWLALQSDQAIAEGVAPERVAAAFDPAGDATRGDVPIAVVEDAGAISAVGVRDVRVLPDGRVGAVVTWYVRRDDGGHRRGPRRAPGESVFRIYDRAGDRWLIDQEIAGNVGR